MNTKFTLISFALLACAVNCGVHLIDLRKEYTVLQVENKKPFDFRVGDSVIIYVPENPTTGYSY